VHAVRPCNKYSATVFFFLLQAVLGALALRLPLDGKAQASVFFLAHPIKPVSSPETTHSTRKKSKSFKSAESRSESPLREERGMGGVPPPGAGCWRAAKLGSYPHAAFLCRIPLGCEGAGQSHFT